MMFTDFTYPEDIDKDLNQFAELIAGKISWYNMEKRYIHKSGDILWGNLFVTTLNDHKGLPQEVIGMVEDITEQKKIHNEITLQASLLNNVGQAVIATDLTGVVIYWNSAAEKIYGWSPDEAIGQNIVMLTPAMQSGKQAVDIMKKLSAGKTWSGEFDVKRKDGSVFPAFVTDTPIVDSNGKLSGIIGISSDSTERKHSEMELISAKERAEESDRLKTAFLHNVSHEIRTPMNAIVGFTTLLGEPGITPENHRSYLEIVTQSSNHLLSIVTDIIEISNLEAGKMKLNMSKVNINSTLERLYKQFNPIAANKGLEFKHETSGS